MALGSLLSCFCAEGRIRRVYSGFLLFASLLDGSMIRENRRRLNHRSLSIMDLLGLRDTITSLKARKTNIKEK